ncbi:DMT family transporter [Rhodobacterales bacterium]|nr:DMT family transporter [Rhodobacterales bacterium]
MLLALAERRSGTVAGIVLMCAGAAFLCFNDAFAKSLMDRYHPVQIIFLRNLIALPFAILIAYRLGGREALVSHRPLAHVSRGILWIGAATLFFTGISRMELAEATAIVFSAPVFVTALSALFLRESVGWRRWLAVLVGFVGVLIVVRPGSATFQPASIYPVATAFLYALLMISARWVDPRESVWTLMLYLVGGGAVLCLPLLPFVWVDIHMGDLWQFLGIALFGTAGITLITQAFRLAPAAVVAPIDYSGLIWATVLGWVFWGEIPDLAAYIGAAVIVSSGIVIIIRESRAARKPAS